MPMPDEIKTAFTELKAYFIAEIARRRKNPGTDLVSALVAAHDEAEALSADELLQFVVLLLLAGNETTTNLIGNGMLALGRNPAAMAALRSKPELMRGAIEEMLRYDGPVQSTFRTATKDTEVGGTPIRGGNGRVRDHRGGKSRPGAIQGSREVRHHARIERACGVRRGHPFLYRRAAGAAGGIDRDWQLRSNVSRIFG